MKGGEYLETMRKEDWEQEGKNQDRENENTLPLFQYWFQTRNCHFIIRENPAV